MMIESSCYAGSTFSVNYFSDRELDRICIQECRTYLCQLFVEPEEYPRIFPNAIQEQKIELAALGP
jgi:hypothetical protein